MTAAYFDTFRSVVALITTTLPNQPSDTLNEAVDGLMDELEAAAQVDLIGAFLSINLVLIDCLARGGDIDHSQVWREISAIATNALAEEEQTP